MTRQHRLERRLKSLRYFCENLLLACVLRGAVSLDALFSQCALRYRRTALLCGQTFKSKEALPLRPRWGGVQHRSHGAVRTMRNALPPCRQMTWHYVYSLSVPVFHVSVHGTIESLCVESREPAVSSSLFRLLHGAPRLAFMRHEN